MASAKMHELPAKRTSCRSSPYQMATASAPEVQWPAVRKVSASIWVPVQRQLATSSSSVLSPSASVLPRIGEHKPDIGVLPVVGLAVLDSGGGGGGRRHGG